MENGQNVETAEKSYCILPSETEILEDQREESRNRYRI
jgi:hypothetical protein